jgi:hypothetical protein
VLSVSMIATQESLPPREAGRIAVAVKRYSRCVVPLPGACGMSSRIGGPGFDEGIFVVVLFAEAELIILSRAGIPKYAGSGSC